MIHVLLVDDHASFRESLALLLERQPDITVVGQAGWLAEARAVGREPLAENAELIGEEIYQVLADREEDGLPPIIETRQIEAPAPSPRETT